MSAQNASPDVPGSPRVRPVAAVPAPVVLPSHAELVRDLKTLRERGIGRIRELDLPALAAAAQVSRVGDGTPDGLPPAMVEVLRRAVAELGDDGPAEAAGYLFGLVRGTAFWSPTDLRERAAGYYHLQPETFRRGKELRLVEHVADEILRLGRSAPEDRPIPGRPRPPSPDQVGQALMRTAWQLTELAGASGGMLPASRFGPYPMPFGAETRPVHVHVGDVAELCDIDVVCSSENVYLSPSKVFAATLSGQLRNAAAHRNAQGDIVDDVVVNELEAWKRREYGGQRPVEPGVVAPTSSGALSARRIRRIYHPAVATPTPQTSEYRVTMPHVARAIRGIFALARSEREEYGLRSICLPLFGAGRGRLEAATSFAWCWPVIQEELTADPTWELHLTTLRADETQVVLRGLHRTLDADEAWPGGSR